MLFLSILTISCETDSPQEVSTNVQDNIPSSVASNSAVQDTISVDTFDTWRENWMLNGAAWLDTAELEAFLMPLDDLAQTLNEPGVADSRFYLGLAQTESGQVAKLMVVGVDAKGGDMVDYDRGDYVYDLSQSCPPLCNSAQ